MSSCAWRGETGTAFEDMAELICMDIGRCSYPRALELQRRLVEEVRRSREERAYLVLVEHVPPVITAGRGRGLENILADHDELTAMGIEVYRASRGGDVTYHGPGQIVGYSVVRVDRHGRDVHQYLRDLEEVLIRAVGRFGILAHREPKLTGIWAGTAKLAAIGVAVRHWVSYHGFAVNVSTDLSRFETIVPCGLRGRSVTSMEALLGDSVRLDDVKTALVECMVEVFGFEGARAAEMEVAG